MCAIRKRRSRSDSTNRAGVDAMEAAKIIVIHPGSQQLRIGRASDLNPLTLLHAIAYKRLQPDRDWPYRDQLLPVIDNINPSRLQLEFEEQRLAVSHILQNCVIDQYNRLRTATPPQQLANYNRASKPEKIATPTEYGADDSIWLDRTATELYDEQLLRLSANDVRNYDVHFPIQRGELNIHKDKGGSLTSVLTHMERIWLYALTQRLGIERKTLSQYSAVLIVSDIYKRSNLREFAALLLQRIGFKSCFMQQDHVAATYGAGLGYACVVDVGDQKCSVSCVEDGISQPESRVRIGYGSGDVTQVLQMLLRKCGFPYRECNVQESYMDARLMAQLKERFCHLQTNVCGAQEKTFNVRRNNGQWISYTLQVGDECILAPMALFNTELLNITGKTRIVWTQLPHRLQADAEDCFDAEYLRETSRRNGGAREQFLDGSVICGGGGMPVTAEDDLNVVDVADDTTTPKANTSNGQQSQVTAASATASSATTTTTAAAQNKERDDTKIFYSANGQVVSLDHAIIRSIDRCSNMELKRKMIGCILLVGGGSKITGLTSWLELKISQQLPGVEVNVFSKEMDAGMVAWKGAAIMSVLDSARELYITGAEWERYGLRVLREKAPFIW